MAVADNQAVRSGSLDVIAVAWPLSRATLGLIACAVGTGLLLANGRIAEALHGRLRERHATSRLLRDVPADWLRRYESTTIAVVRLWLVLVAALFFVVGLRGVGII